jgi:NAD-dependent deacetylase
MNHQAVPPASLVSHLRTARHIVVLSGAGMSAESGIPTFRDQGSGLWSRFNPQALATPEAFSRDPETVWAWYEWRRRHASLAVPHAGHFALTALAARPEVEAFTIVTQNVDDLHERAGAKAVLHLHGSLFAPRCFDCGRAWAGLADALEQEPERIASTRLAPPRCATCNGLIRPGVVWFGEGLPEAVWLEARRTVERADLLLVVGTSGLVYPAAGLPDAARSRGCAVSVINPDASSMTGSAMDWQIQAGVGLPILVSSLDT